VGKFSTFVLPLIRKVYPKLYVNNIVSVQPMMPRNQKRKP
jgi:hypothetical protein